MEPIKIYKVGGCIRDSILGKQPKDIDYAVEASSFDTMRNYLLENGATIYLEKPEYLTIRAKYNKTDADFVLCRKDGIYKDGRRPESTEMGTIYDDLTRRDFRMNAISQDIVTGEFYDPFNGIQDIKDKVIRCVGSIDRLSEDYLRMLRAIRFSITLGFTMDSEIYVHIHDNWELLKEIAIERIVDEMNKAFNHSVHNTIYTFYNKFGISFTEWLFDHPEIFMKLVVRKS
jgi:tRNA nucleotidyltransferase (CCA-adding enzyme)